MPKSVIQYFLKFLFLLAFLFYLNAEEVKAMVLFQDDFNLGNSGKWNVARNDCIPDEWVFDGSKYGIDIDHVGGCVTETVPNNANWNNSWNDYVFELDATFVSGFDRNIAWRYINSDYWIDLHIFGTSIEFQRVTLVNSSNIQPIYNGNTYHFKVEVVGNNFKVYYYNLNNPDNVSYMEGVDFPNTFSTGRPALQASVGAMSTSEVWFDNVVVTSIDDQLDVPYFSQIDSNWTGEPYDSINASIGQAGCLLSAGAMALGFYGVDFLPDGTPFDVLTLNNWLTSQPDGFGKEGRTNLPALIRLAKELNDKDSSIPILKYKKSSPPDFDEIDNILTNLKQPVIFEEFSLSSSSGVHFTVATDVIASGQEYSIMDPFDATRSSILISSGNLISTRYFYPTTTDLSNLLFNYDKGLTIQLTGPDASSSGMLSSVYPLADDINHGNVLGEEFWELLTQGPSSGQYQIELTATESSWYNWELFAYDKDSNVKTFKKSVYVDSNNPINYTLDYSKEGNEFAILKKVVNFDTVLADIASLFKAGEIKKPWALKFLTSIIEFADRVHLIHRRMTKRLIRIFDRNLNRFLRRRYISRPAYNLLKEDIRMLKKNLEF